MHPHGLAASLLVLLVTSPALAQEAPAPPIVRIGILGDAQEPGEREPFRQALAELAAQNASLVLYGGDTNNLWGPPPADWVAALGPYSDRMLFVVGNHDEGRTYARWFPPGTRDTWWNATLAPGVEVVALDTERDLFAGKPQRAWLEAQLAAHRDDTLILIMHIPYWAGNFHHKKALDFPGDAADMDALVAKYDVDLVLAAHEHYYLRSERGGVPFVINSAVDARTRTVPPDLVANATVHSELNRTWMRMDIHACRLHLVTTLHEEGGSQLDGFSIDREDEACGRATPLPAHERQAEARDTHAAPEEAKLAHETPAAPPPVAIALVAVAAAYSGRRRAAKGSISRREGS